MFLTECEGVIHMEKGDSDTVPRFDQGFIFSSSKNLQSMCSGSTIRLNPNMTLTTAIGGVTTYAYF